MCKLINIEFNNQNAVSDEDQKPSTGDHLDEYVRQLIDSEKDAQDNYDKTILSLSSGALGISFAFIKDIVGTDPISNPSLLILAWICWVISMTSVLYSFYVSNRAFRKAIDQAYKGHIFDEHPGGVFEKITNVLNVLSGSLFVVGLILIIIFVNYNI